MDDDEPTMETIDVFSYNKPLEIFVKAPTKMKRPISTINMI